MDPIKHLHAVITGQQHAMIMTEIVDIGTLVLTSSQRTRDTVSKAIM